MIYIDETRKQIENPDLTKGYLVEAEWVNHPAVDEVGHYEYSDLEGGGQLQKYVVDFPFAPAWREVTVMKYIAYTEEELEQMNKADVNARLDALEATTAEHEYALEAIAEGATNA